jgi:hypothetical protein
MRGIDLAPERFPKEYDNGVALSQGICDLRQIRVCCAHG